MRLVLELDDQVAADVVKLVESFDTPPDACSHGELTVEKLALMLLEDAALAYRRPGSWEGANMLDVLSSHGYAP